MLVNGVEVPIPEDMPNRMDLADTAREELPERKPHTRKTPDIVSAISLEEFTELDDRKDIEILCYEGTYPSYMVKITGTSVGGTSQ